VCAGENQSTDENRPATAAVTMATRSDGSEPAVMPLENDCRPKTGKNKKKKRYQLPSGSSTVVALLTINIQSGPKSGTLFKYVKRSWNRRVAYCVGLSVCLSVRKCTVVKRLIRFG